jgi:hypothetical protein
MQSQQRDLNGRSVRTRTFASVSLLALAALTSAGPLRGAEPKSHPGSQAEVLLERVEKIYSDGKWNGRAAIVLWKGRYYIFFRTGAHHDSPDGAIRMMHTESNTPRQWSTSPFAAKNYQATAKAGRPLDPIGPGPSATVVIDTPRDEQEAHLLATPERLFAYTVVDDRATGGVEGTMVSFTENATDWSEPEFVYEPGWSFWKPVSREGVHYVAADVMTGNRRVDLLSSTDGLEWKKVSTIAEGALTEIAIVFLKDGTLLAVARQGWIYKADPPYTTWTSRKLRTSIDGPALELVGDTVLASGRAAAANFPADDQNGTRRTALFVVDPNTLELKWKMNMLTQWGGDLSYPHLLALDDHRALMVWYDGQRYEKGIAKQADLFLTVLRVQ